MTEDVQKKQNFTLDEKLPIFTDDTSKLRRPEIFYVPNATFSEYADLDLKDNAMSHLDKTMEGRNWKASVMNGARITTHKDRFLDSLYRPDSFWQQDIQFKDSVIRSRSVQMQGSAAHMRIRQKLKLGIPFEVVLPHTGSWVKIDSAGDDEIVELHRAINAERIMLGRQSFGAIFSSLRGYISKILLSFIRSKIVATGINCDINDLFNHIDILDVDSLIVGFAQATWPNGFEYSRACTANPGVCTHITKGRIMPIRTQWFDINSLTDRQKSILSRRGERSVSIEDLKIYKAEFIRGKSIFVDLSDEEDNSIQAELKTCTIAQYIDGSYRWISSLEERYTSALITDADERNNYLYTQSKATMMRMYGHFTSAIYEDGVATVTSIEDIEETLGVISAADKIKDRFIEQVGKFIDEATICVIAIPEYECPACGEDNEADKNMPKFKGLIPIDASKAFFTLMVQTVEKLNRREM